MDYLVNYTVYQDDKPFVTKEKQLELDHPEFAIDGLCELGLHSITDGQLNDPLDNVTLGINHVVEVNKKKSEPRLI